MRKMTTIMAMCQEQTVLAREDAERIEELARSLQLIADVSQSDVFIDCPTADPGAALVVAQAHPRTFPSLYRTSVVGQFAHAHNEPAVMYTLASGHPVVGSRGTSQEQVAVQQNVVPILSSEGRVIGALIMEQDITEKVAQERHVKQLKETTETLSQTLLTFAMAEGGMPQLMHEGIILFDERGRVTYTNPQAARLLREVGVDEMPEGRDVGELFYGRIDRQRLLGRDGVFHQELQWGASAWVLKAVSIYREQQAYGGLMLIRDITDLMEKEKQLTVKAAVIKEIHHRVKNNLQTVSSLLRLQMRRTKHAEVAHVYRDSINRINSIALIHEMLAYEGADAISFHAAVEKIASNVISASAKPDQAIRAHVDGTALVLPSEPATTLALAVNELIQNCVVHAFADRESGEISITLHQAGQIASVRIADNGIGMRMGNARSGTGMETRTRAGAGAEAGADSGTDSDTSSGTNSGANSGTNSGANSGASSDAGTDKQKDRLGLKIVETLVSENLDGVLDIHSDEQGTSAQITFPLSGVGSKEGDAP